jgi:transcriptional regulator with XRE-family HTH domain
MPLVENIRYLCKEKQTSVPRLEKEFGWGHGAIYRWDANSPSIDKLQKVADYFNVTVDHLISKEQIITTPSGRYKDVPLDTKTLSIMCRIPLLNETNQAIISDMIESMIKNQG